MRLAQREMLELGERRGPRPLPHIRNDVRRPCEDGLGTAGVSLQARQDEPVLLCVRGRRAWREHSSGSLLDDAPGYHLRHEAQQSRHRQSQLPRVPGAAGAPRGRRRDAADARRGGDEDPGRGALYEHDCRGLAFDKRDPGAVDEFHPPAFDEHRPRGHDDSAHDQSGPHQHRRAIDYGSADNCQRRANNFGAVHDNPRLVIGAPRVNARPVIIDDVGADHPRACDDTVRDATASCSCRVADDNYDHDQGRSSDRCRRQRRRQPCHCRAAGAQGHHGAQGHRVATGSLVFRRFFAGKLFEVALRRTRRIDTLVVVRVLRLPEVQQGEAAQVHEAGG
mmetsp:Transcript_61669/g.177508  ORF Transcript_61669/g.177508 Transcript_61669/m.177508 type:complete len:336 (+) Transcript_61669:962-1969(+)